MIGHTTRQASLFYFAFAREVSAIKDVTLDELDALLQDDELLALTSERLGGRCLRSKNFGRPGIAPDRLLRCVVRKHLKSWSFRELEYELRHSLLYRRFTRFFEDPIPDFTSFSRTFGLFGAEGTRQIHQRVLAKAQEQKLARGRKLRIDTTAVETNIHYPTDSTLLADSLRVMTRCLKRIASGCAGQSIKIVDHARAAKYRLLEICRAAKSFTEASRAAFKESYGKLLALTRRVRRQAGRVLEQLNAHELKVQGGNLLTVLGAEAQLQRYLPLVDQVMVQTQARIFEGETRCEGKILSLFEEHSAIIRKGKPDKPTEFGRLVRLDEVENGIISGYSIAAGNPADQQQWVPALEEHRKVFGRVPQLATADRGFWSSANEKSAQDLGIAQVVLPATGRLSSARAERQKQRWFRQGQGWRAGIEPRISTLKHQFGMKRARYKGDAGFQRYVGWCIITQNLVAAARSARKAEVKARCRSG
jgi:IS5 family transposase